MRGDSLTRHGVLANHALRRAYATAATNAGVDEDIDLDGNHLTFGMESSPPG